MLIEHLTESKVNVLIVYLINVSIIHLFYLALKRSNAHMATLPPGVADGQNVQFKHSISEYHKTSQIPYLNFYFPKQKKPFSFTIILCWFHFSVLRTKAIFEVSDLFWKRIFERMNHGKMEMLHSVSKYHKIKLTCKHFFHSSPLLNCGLSLSKPRQSPKKVLLLMQSHDFFLRWLQAILGALFMH